MKPQIISLVIAVSLLGLWFVGTRPLPESMLTRINITSDDYRSALAKWQAQGVEEYIMVVEYKSASPTRAFVPNGIHTLHVTHGQVALLGSSNAAVSDRQQNFDLLTVDALFNRVSDPDKLTRRCDFLIETIYFEHVIHFDGRLGYPKRIEVIAQNEIGREVSSLECGYSHVTEIKSIEILKRR